MLSFENRVIIITGAAQGLGAEYAKFFASRKAKLYLNDIHKQGNAFLVDVLADQLRKEFGCEVVTNKDSVDEGHKIIEGAIQTFKKIDVLINNAGQLIDRGMTKVTIPDFDNIVRTHLKGTFRCTLAAWPYFRKQKYGRIINTSSAAGLYGNFGQTAYSSSKAGIHGMTLALAKEGENYNIKVNSIAPLANTRMTQGVVPEDLIVSIPANSIAPFVGVLAHEECPESGQIFELGGGWFAKLRIQRAEGGSFPLNQTPEHLLSNWSLIGDYTRNNDYPTSGSESIEKMFENFEKQSSKKSENQEPANQSKSNTIYRLMKVYVESGQAKKAVQKCDSVYQFNITDKPNGNSVLQFWVSVKSSEQKAETGVHKSPDATFTISDSDFSEVCLGKLNPQVAFAKKLMKISGNFKKATAFTPDLFPAPTQENIDKYLKGQPKL